MLKESGFRLEGGRELEDLWEKRLEQLRRRAWGTGLLNSKDEVEDVLQEAAVSILERLDAGEPIRRMAAYAKQTVHRKACDLRRRGMRKEPRQEAGLAPATQERDADVRAGVFEENRRRFWKEVVENICPADRTVLGLLWEGLKEGRIAEILRKTPGAVYASRSRINRAMEAVARRQGVASEEDLFGPALWPKGPAGGGRRRSQGEPWMSDSDGSDVSYSRDVERDETPEPPEGGNWNG